MTCASCSNSSAACANKRSSIEIAPQQVSKGETFEIQGRGFGEVVECDDTRLVGGEVRGPQFEPLNNISIKLQQGSRTWELATVDADQEATFDEKLVLPSEAVSGQATVFANGIQGRVEHTVTVVN